MAKNRALVAVSANDTWLFLVVKGKWVEHEESEVDPELAHLDGLTALPQGLTVVDFDLTYRARPPDECDVTAVNVTTRRPTVEEVWALNTENTAALHALWSDITSEED